jgi:hypothetical protein
MALTVLTPDRLTRYFMGDFMLKKLSSVYLFYLDGFKGMTIGKKLWGIICIKLFVMFAVLKVFFFPNFLKSNFATDEERGNHVMEQLIKPAAIVKTLQ